MKKTITKWIGIAAMAGAIAFSLIQMRVPVVRADGCPDNPWPGCMCNLTNTVVVQYGEQTTTYCYYSCGCGGPGGGEFFEIQREWVY
ncbi:MAG TPA: hypothetical protein VN643_15420 [Pyrinomonadaceae bacterium]|nr:hypothetical protein [Pyrinomonadaceae bacterium]